MAVAIGERLSRLSGERLQDYRSLVTAWLDRAFFDLAAKLETNLLFECGAHEASASTAFADRGGRAVALEANPDTCSSLTAKAAAHGVVVLNCGVGSHSGEANFYVPRNPEQAGNASFLRQAGLEYTCISMRMTTLDALGGEYLKSDDRLAIWLDVEGFAADVLKGGLSILKDPRCRILKVEVETEPHWDGQVLADWVDDLLTECGFTPVLRDIEYANQYNVIYVRRELSPGLDEMLIHQWAKLAAIRPVRFPAGLRSVAHVLKRGLLHDSPGPLLVHRAAAALGSISSAKIIAAARDKKR